MFLTTSKYDPSAANRQRWARAIEGLIATPGTQPWRTRPFRPLYAPVVVQACTPALTTIRDILGDEHASITTQMLRQVHEFLCEGATSPLLGNDPVAARKAANELATSFQLAAPAREPQRSITVEAR